jgi:BirA family biotin operon repressor/biotin-[acetyl-CoA-carboxylase] ligase
MSAGMREFPEILNRLAEAGEQGVEFPLDDPAWNAISLACDWGFQIGINANRAWLSSDPDALIPTWIERETPRVAWASVRAIGFLEIDSTNSEALRRICSNAAEGTVIFAEHQTAGRGRFSRRWFSPARAGLYFSVILRPQQPLQHWPLLTHSAGVALVRALQQLATEERAGNLLSIDLKWPNDVLLAGKKVAGILLESTQSGSGSQAAVLGVGINVTTECIPVDSRQTVTALECEAGKPLPRRKLLIHFLSHFQQAYLTFEKGELQSILKEWKDASSMWNEVPVWIDEGGRRREVTTCGITPGGALMIRTGEGKKEIVLAGDVRIRRLRE